MIKNKIIISKKITSTEIRQYYKVLENSSEDISLQFPQAIEYRGFGIVPELLLFFFTWVRQCSGKLILELIPEKQNKIKEFVDSYLGYIIVSTAWRHCDIINLDGKLLRNDLKKFTKPFHSEIDNLSDRITNETVSIVCFDHFSTNKGLPHWFYDSENKFITTPSGLENSIHKILKSISRIYSKRLINNLSKSFDAIVRIVWELMKNTDEHGTKDHLGQVNLLPNTRGLYLRVHRSSKSNFIKNTDHLGLKKYYENALLQNDQSFMLEMSFFDSGSGLVKNFLGEDWSKNLSTKDEVNIVRTCLTKGESSIQSKNEHKGLGLDEVLKLLSYKNGFLKIISGNLILYRDLTQHKYQETIDPSNILLTDWEKMSSDDYTKVNYSEGTLLTLAIPLN